MVKKSADVVDLKSSRGIAKIEYLTACKFYFTSGLCGVDISLNSHSKVYPN